MDTHTIHRQTIARGNACSGGCRAALAERDDKLLEAIVGVWPANGEDAVWFVVVVCSCEWLLKAANLWQVVVMEERQRERVRRRFWCVILGGGWFMPNPRNLLMAK